MNDHHQYGRTVDEDNQDWINRELNKMEEGGILGGAAGGAGMTGQRKAGDNYFGTDTQTPGRGGTGGWPEIMPTASGSRRSAEANFLNAAFGHGLGGSPVVHGRRSGGTQSEHRHPFQSLLQSPPQLQQQQQQLRSLLDTSLLDSSLQHQMRSPSLQYLQAQGQYDDSPRGQARAAYERRREERRRQLQQQQQPETEAASASTASARPAQVSSKKRNRGGRKRSAYAVSEYAGSGDAGEETMDQLRDRAARAMQEVALLRDQNSIQYNDQYEYEFDNGPENETEAAPFVENVSPHSGRKEQAASADDDGAHDSSSSSCGRDAFDSSDSEESEQSEYRTDDEEDESEDSDDDNGVLLTPRANGTGTDAGRNRRGRPAQMGAVANADTISRTIRARALHHNIRRRGSSSNAATGAGRPLAQPSSGDEMVVVVDSSEDEEQQQEQQQKRARTNTSGTSRRSAATNSNQRGALPPANSDEMVVVDDSSEDEEQPQQRKRARVTVSGAAQSSRRRRTNGGGRGGANRSCSQRANGDGITPATIGGSVGSTLATLGLSRTNPVLDRFARNLFVCVPPEHLPTEWFCSPDTTDDDRELYLSTLFPDSAKFANYVAGGDVAKRLVDEALAMAGVENERAKVTALGYLQDRNIGLAICLMFVCSEAENALAGQTVAKFAKVTMKNTDSHAKGRALRTVASILDARVLSGLANLGDRDINTIKQWVKDQTQNKNKDEDRIARASAMKRLATVLLLCPLSQWHQPGAYGHAGIEVGVDLNDEGSSGTHGGGGGPNETAVVVDTALFPPPASPPPVAAEAPALSGTPTNGMRRQIGLIAIDTMNDPRAAEEEKAKALQILEQTMTNGSAAHEIAKIYSDLCSQDLYDIIGRVLESQTNS